jgi:small subunit ribosomal protein S17
MAAETNAQNPKGSTRHRTTRSGVVVSDKMDKTVVVAVRRLVQHPRYRRVVRRTSKFHAHDEKNVCRLGDVVLIVESRPLSKQKRWRVREVLRKGTPALGKVVDTEIAGTETGRPASRRKAPPSAAEEGEPAS